MRATGRQVTVITSGGRSLLSDLREIWAARELLYFLAWREVMIRYKQTVIGVAWAVLQPVVTTAIFTLLFGMWARFDTGDIPYPVFALSGLLIWLFTHSAVSVASNSFVNNVNLVTKIYFPRMIIPIAATVAPLLDMLIGAVLLGILMAYYRVPISSKILLAPIFLILAVVNAVAFGTLLSAVNVRFRDIKFALPFVLQVWMIASPIFYPASMLSERSRMLFAINPLVGIIEGFRSAIFSSPTDWTLVAISTVSIGVLVLVASVVFTRMESEFADII